MYGIREKRRRRRRIRIAVCSVAAFVFVLAAIYFGMTAYFRTHFLFRTEINGLEVGKLTVQEAEEKIAEDEGSYLLIISDRDKNLHQINGSDMGCNYKPDGSIKKALKKQNPYGWIKALFRGNRIDVKTPMEYDEEKLTKAVQELDCFASENVTPPTDATIKLVDGEYQVIPEDNGNELILDQVVAAVEQAVSEGDGELYLTDEDYVKPSLTTESATITDAMATINKYLNAQIDYQISDYDEKLDADDIIGMIRLQDDYSVTIDQDKIADFVQRLASKYNTYADVRKFKTSSGDTIEIGGGDYGWVIDKEKEAAEVLADIESGETTKREPIYNQRAQVEGLDDIGNTYVEVDYTKQHLWYYENGEMKLDSDIVSGNIASGNGSPDGVFKIVYKQSPAVLVGEDYESNVDYFMVFAYNVGFHDASWRNGQFGGQYYKTIGSHGCVNMPGDKAASLYEMIKKDTPVVAYYREPIELTANNCKISNAYSYVDPEKKAEEEKAAQAASAAQAAGQTNETAEGNAAAGENAGAAEGDAGTAQ